MMLPHLLTSRLKEILGSEYESVLQSFSAERMGSFRINTLKGNGEAVFREFEARGIRPMPCDGIEGAYFYDRSDEYSIKGSDAFYSGKIYLQSISSLLPALTLDVTPGMSVLDICAAPGSKTTQIASLMNNSGNIIALEQNQIRYDKLLYNAKLQGATIIEGKKLDARNFLHTDHHSYDRILLDAPCSAEGRISLSNEKTYGFWSLENIEKKLALQYELLSLALPRLKSGGILVYSTCTLAPEENEGVIEKILSEHPDITIVSIDIGLSGKKWWKMGLSSFEAISYREEMRHTVRILPSGETEGFYLAKIMKL